MAGRKPIEVDRVKEALDIIKQEHVRKGLAKPIPGAKQGQQKYSYPKIRISNIAKRAKYSRDALYRTIALQRKEDATEEEIKRSRRLEGLVKPFMREPVKPDDAVKPGTKAWYKEEVGSLKKRLARYEKKLGEVMKQKIQSAKAKKCKDGDSEKVKELKKNAQAWHKEVEMLKEENERLKEENAKLRGEAMKLESQKC
ncbi:MAG: hypothetical protein WBG65_00460 [Sulfurimonadaceae bacterium]